MTRQIKFRAWDKDKKEMIDPLILAGIETRLSHILAGFSNMPLMQFTGLTDRNGKEIYEGDIVEGSTEVYEKGGYRSKEREKATVEITVDGVRFNQGPYKKYSRFEIIGNIYENPDLIK